MLRWMEISGSLMRAAKIISIQRSGSSLSSCRARSKDLVEGRLTSQRSLTRCWSRLAGEWLLLVVWWTSRSGVVLPALLNMDVHFISALLHPGDLSRWELAGIIGVFFALCILPLVVIGFIVYRMVVGHSQAGSSVTLSLNERRSTDS